MYAMDNQYFSSVAMEEFSIRNSSVEHQLSSAIGEHPEDQQQSLVALDGGVSSLFMTFSLHLG